MWCTGPVAPRHVGSSQSRARTRVPCIGRQILNHCATREAPSKSFIVSGLTFRSLIHFEFIFVYGVRDFSNFILSHVAVQFSQHHLLKRLSFLHCISLSPLKNKVTICAWVYLWAFYPGSLIYISIFGPVPYCLDYCSFLVDSEVREPDSSGSVFLSQDCFGYSGSFVFPYKL